MVRDRSPFRHRPRFVAELPDVLSDLARRGVSAAEVAAAMHRGDRLHRDGSALYVLTLAVMAERRGGARRSGVSPMEKGLGGRGDEFRSGMRALLGGLFITELGRLCERIEEASEVRLLRGAVDRKDLREALDTLARLLQSSLPEEIAAAASRIDTAESDLDRCRSIVQCLEMLGAEPAVCRYYLDGWFPQLAGELEDPVSTWTTLCAGMPLGSAKGASLLKAAEALRQNGDPRLALEASEAAAWLQPSSLHASLLAALCAFESGESRKGLAAFERWLSGWWPCDDVTELFQQVFAKDRPVWSRLLREERGLASLLEDAPKELSCKLHEVLE